jgi:hypothetical protein
MMPINLNDPKILNKDLSKEELLSKYTDYDIFRYYLGDFEIGETYRSPLRTNDKIPSFNVFYSKQYGCLLFKDFAGRRGDCIRFVQYLLGLRTYYEAINKIDNDMSNSIYIPKTEFFDTPKLEKVYTDIKVVKDSWKTSDLDFWNSFGISQSTLELFNVIPIKGYYMNDIYNETKGLAYAYIEFKDKEITYKIYRPNASKENKWRTNHPFNVHQGYTQLPSTGELLIITKSLKDVMSLYEVVKKYSIGIQAESSYIKDSVVYEYKSRFKRVITLFDNDRQGIYLANSYSEKYDLPSIFIPDEYHCKDFSDLVKNYGKPFAVSILNKLLL